jgi:hypothetical protein
VGSMVRLVKGRVALGCGAASGRLVRLVGVVALARGGVFARGWEYGRVATLVRAQRLAAAARSGPRRVCARFCVGASLVCLGGIKVGHVLGRV